jgi:predicted nucleotidyltransferase
MISNIDKDSIITIARKYKVSRVLLFGSSASSDKEGNDIDLAVDGISSLNFFSFYRDLIFKLTKPVDVIVLSDSTKFHRMIEAEGIPIYG